MLLTRMAAVLGGALAALGVASAGIDASGYLTYTESGSQFTYDIHLTNTGNVDIGTLWFAWIPGESFMLNAPISTGNPAGWHENLISHEPGTGYGIRWVATTALAPGASMDGFTFKSL